MNMELITTIKTGLGEIPSEQAFNWFQESSFVSIPPYFLTHWKTKKSFFFFEGSLLAFEKTKGRFIITGEPALNEKTDEKNLYKSFLDFAHKSKKQVSGYYVGETWEQSHFLKQPLGTSFRLNLKNYNLNTSKAKEVRRSLRKGLSSEYQILELPNIDHKKLKTLMKKWESKKLPFKLKFFLSEPEQNSLIASYEKWYVIEKNQKYFAFCSLLPYKHDGVKGFYIDHLIYDPLEEKSALSFLISSLISNLKEKGVDEINLGLNPFAKVAPEGFIGKLFYYLYHLPIMYRPKGLHYFKSKFAGIEEPEFFFYEKDSSPFASLMGMFEAAFKH